MPLKGIKVLEFAGLAPAPFCGKILADFGAKVTRIDRSIENFADVMQQGKSTLAINIKNSKGQELIKQLAKTHDVIIEAYRPGVMERSNLGPDVLCKVNPRLIYARLTGFGQYGRLSQRAGHDINYIAISGVLSMLGPKNEKPMPPINLLADFAGGGLICAMGICLALLERAHSGCGQVVDAAMVEGAAYVASWLFQTRTLPALWQGEKGSNTLDGGAFYYDTYETKDGKYMSVGALEPQFFMVFKERLNLSHLTQEVYSTEEQEAMRAAVRSAFLTKTQAEWSEIFEDSDACVYPVVDWQDVKKHSHNSERDSYLTINELPVPKPAPRLSRTPGFIKSNIEGKEAVNDVLAELKNLSFKETELQQLIDEKVIVLPTNLSKL